jgi:hypothetical protein
MSQGPQGQPPQGHGGWQHYGPQPYHGPQPYYGPQQFYGPPQYQPPRRPPPTDPRVWWGLGLLIAWGTVFLFAKLSPTFGFCVAGLTLVLGCVYGFAVRSPNAPAQFRAAAEQIKPYRLKSILIVACLGTGGLAGAALGVVRSREDAERQRIARESHEKECAGARASAPVARTPGEKRDAAQVLLTCGEQEWANSLRSEADRQEVQEAALAKEAKAKADWPSVLKRVDAALAASEKLIRSGKLLDADDLLAQEQERLGAFVSTGVASDIDFVAAQGRIETKRKDLAAKVAPLRKARADAEERERKKREAADREATAQAELRGPKPLVSGWDGSVLAVERYLRPRLKDPDSLDMANCTQPVIEGAYWVTACAYRARNSFGALVLEGGKFYIQAGGIGGDGEVVKVESLE